MATLADVYAEIQLTPPTSWPAVTLQKTLQALTRLERLLETTLSMLPADAGQLEAIVKGRLNWSRDGFSSSGAFRNWLGRIKRAVRETKVGRKTLPRFTRCEHYQTDWQELYKDIKVAIAKGCAPPWTWRSLAHLAGYANWRGAGLQDVNSTLLEDLLAMHRATKQRDGNALDYASKAIAAARTWNLLIRRKAEECPTWLERFPAGAQLLTWESRKRELNPSLTAYPKSFQNDVADLSCFLKGTRLPSPEEDEFAGCDDVVKPDQVGKTKRSCGDATIRNYTWAIIQTAGALVRAGTPIGAIRSVADVCNADALMTSLRDYKARHKNTDKTASRHQLAAYIRSVAATYAQADQDELAIMKQCAKRVHNDSCGTISIGRQQMLMPFDEPANLEMWFDRPGKLFARAEAARAKSIITASTIADVETAILASLFGILPVRRSNACSLRHRGEHRTLFLGRHAHEKSWVQWPKEEVKNRRYLRAQLDVDTARYIRAYLAHYRPVYMQISQCSDSEFLFPGDVSDRYGVNHRSFSNMGANFSARFNEVGLRVTLHLSRHLSAKIILDDDERLLTMVADLLGDHVETVRQFYLTNRTARASAAYRDVLKRRLKALKCEWISEEALTAGRGQPLRNSPAIRSRKKQFSSPQR